MSHFHSLSSPFLPSVASLHFLSYHPLSLLSFVFLLSILYPLISSFSPFSLLPFSLLFLSISSPLCPFSPISFLLSPPYFTSPFSLLSLLSPIPSLSSPFLPSLLYPIHYLSYILSQFSLFSSFISAPISVSPTASGRVSEEGVRVSGEGGREAGG